MCAAAHAPLHSPAGSRLGRPEAPDFQYNTGGSRGLPRKFGAPGLLLAAGTGAQRHTPPACAVPLLDAAAGPSVVTVGYKNVLGVRGLLVWLKEKLRRYVEALAQPGNLFLVQVSLAVQDFGHHAWSSKHIRQVFLQEMVLLH